MVVGGWGQGVGARGVVRVKDKEVRYLIGKSCASVCVLRFDHAPAPAVVLPFEEDVSADQGGALGVHGFKGRGVGWVLVECEAWW